MMKDKKILVIGHGRHGKDTVSGILSALYGITFKSSSLVCAKVVTNYMNANGSNYKSERECFEDRHNNREAWKTAIVEYNTPDKTRLAREILETNSIYCGLRDKEEFEACVDANVFDYILYIDASLRIPDLDPTFEIEYDPDTMVRIDNNSDRVEDLLIELGRKLKRIGEKK